LVFGREDFMRSMRRFAARLARALAREGGSARAVGVTLLCGAVLLPASCGEHPRPAAGWPPGLLVVGRTEALARLLARLERLEPTPLARGAREIRRALPACDTVEARSASGDLAELRQGLACRSNGSDFDRLDRERGDRDLAFVWRADGGAPVRGTLSIGPRGDLELAASLPRSSFAGARSLLQPGVAAAGPSVLSGADSLIHVRLRPEGGLAIADLVAGGSQADLLFRLKSELFAGSVLEGTWEAAVYVPEPPGSMPRAALALGVVRREAAVAAMEAFVRELRAAWPVHRSFFAVGEAAGACLLDLNVLPELAPCYVATDRALVVAWNPASLRKALEGEPANTVVEAAGATVDFERIAEVDAELAVRVAPESERILPEYPWRRLEAQGRRVGDEVQVRLRLMSGAET
jgi:hypothetical protein